MRNGNHTLGTGTNTTVLDNLEAVAQLTNNATILLVDQYNSAADMRAGAALDVCFPRLEASWVVGRRRVAGRFSRLGLGSLGARGPRRRRALEESGALRQNRLKGIDVLLDPRATVGGGELEARKGAAARAKVPPGDQVAAGRLVVDLRRRGHGEVELGREVQVQVKILLAVAARDARRVGEARRGRDHEERERLRARGREGLLVAIGNVVGLDAIYGVEELRILEGIVVKG